MFTSLRLTNFKAYRDTGEVPLRPLTLVLGANNSGKSSLLHSILLLAQTLEDSTSRQPLVTSGSYVDLGGYYDILWGAGHRKDQGFGIEIKADGANMDNLTFGGGTSDERPSHLKLAFAFDAGRNAIVVSSASVTGHTTTFSSARRAGRGYTAPHLTKEARSGLELGWRHFLPMLQPAAHFSIDNPNVRNMCFKGEQAWYSWTRQLAGVSHVAPLRQPVPRFGILGKSPTSELGPGGENLLRALRSDEDSIGPGSLVEDVSQWISGEFQMLDELRVVTVDESGTVLALLGDEHDGFQDINVANMGEGISQLLPIVARVLTTAPGGSLLIEQPELHLHPAAQADLADLFIHGARDGNRQYVVETHSEHMLLRLRRRIAEGAISPDDVAVLYVERDDTSSSVRTLDMNEAGHFNDWPSGFFEERYLEALAIVEAVERQRSGS